MARVRSAEAATRPFSRTLNTPGGFLRGMFIFLVLVGFIIAIIGNQLAVAFWNNPALNGLIVTVLSIGILRAFAQVFRLYREVRWVNAFRIADPGLAIEHKPVLLSPMATMLRDRTGALSLSAQTMRSIMDSIGGRLDESRETGRYLVGLLVFLGLLGTFWGLLETIESVGKAINTLDTRQSDSVLVFEELKNGLAAPLKGMGTAFSASLLGLSGSLVLGFLELQANHAHNRFYNELEEWLSGITDLSPASGVVGSDPGTRQLQIAVHDLQRAITDLGGRIEGAGDDANGTGGQPVRELAQGVDQLVQQMRAEQKVVREWIDDQATRQTEVAAVLKDLAKSMARRGA
ncbi:MAG: flagellar motor protein MotA [Hyphomicrobiaceae bacterium]